MEKRSDDSLENGPARSKAKQHKAQTNKDLQNFLE